MTSLTRRSLLRNSVGLVAAGALERPYIANAAATTATVWWAQGFAQEEDVSFKKIVADYEKASGNTLDYSIIPFAPERQKIISAMTSGEVPDMFGANPAETIALFAWDGRLVDVSDVVETQKEEYTETALLSAYCYNNKEKKRSYYGVPYTGSVVPSHIWKSLVEKAGYKIEDIPKTWDAYFDFFKDVQKKLREQRVRNVYGIGFQITTNGVDPNQLFHYFLIAYGGQGLVTKDGKLHVGDPQVKEAAIKTVSYPITAYKEGFVPPGAINWNDADDNNAFHAKQIVMDLDGTISTEVAIFNKKEDYNDIVTRGLPLDNDGKELTAQIISFGPVIPKGAKNIAVAKDFLKYAVQPKVLNEYLKGGLGRWMIPIPEIAKSDPFWLKEDPHREAYTKLTLLAPTMPIYEVYNPAIAQVNAEHLFSVAMFDVMKGGMAPEAAIAKAFKRAEEIFAKYPIQQA
jgi:multiple sugar transport system substrate-binding protein